ncbi:MAG: hypothetical protein Q4C49_00415 [Bacillota bacterium]|nr:hypothetical protein [Bacillota bacterium]
MAQANEMYGLELDEDTFETYGMSAWYKIGNKDYRMRITKAVPQADPAGGWYVCMPGAAGGGECGCSGGSNSEDGSDITIEAITLDFEDAQETSSIMNFPGVYTHPIEQWIEYDKRMPNELYIPGKYVKFKVLGDRIYFTEPYPSVNILYKSLYVDEEGLPFINQKEMEAIAVYCAYAEDMKKARLTKDQGTFQMAQLEFQRW